MRSKRTLAAGVLFLLVPSFVGAQQPNRIQMREDLFALASPEFEGRETGSKGQFLAADLVARRFKEAGLLPLKTEGFGGATPYHWPYTLERWRLDVGASIFNIGSHPLNLGSEAFTSRATPGDGEAVFLGYGVMTPGYGWNEYENINVKGKWVVAFDGEAPKPKGVEAAAWSRACASETKADYAKYAGAIGLILVQDSRTGSRDLKRLGGVLSRLAQNWHVALKGAATPWPPTILISSEGLKAFPVDLPTRQEEIDAARKPIAPLPLGHLTYTPRSVVEAFPASNVMGLLVGKDPQLKNDIIVLSAHHDHLGLEGGLLHPGADDNASGTTVLMTVARMLKGAAPRRSILFLSVSGEEIGLFGSEAFISTPPVDLARIKADLNIDMVGRNDAHELSVTPARVVGAITTLTEQARRLAPSLGLRLTDEADKYWTRSDHYTFVKHGIPSIFFFGGMHADYHKATDTPDKIDFEKLARVASFVKALALATANATEAPKTLPREVWSQWVWPSQPSPPAALDGTHQ